MTIHPDLFESMVNHVIEEIHTATLLPHGSDVGLTTDASGNLAIMVQGAGTFPLDRAVVESALLKWSGEEIHG